jgi:hypothetical protein
LSFSGSGLIRVSVPDHVSFVGDEVFRRCTNLTSLTFGANSELRILGEGMCVGCVKLETVVLPNHLGKLGSCFFLGCSSLRGVTLPFNLTEIGSYAFSMSGIRQLTLPDSILSVNAGALSGSAIEVISIGNKVGNFSVNVFSHCSHLKEVHLRGEVVTGVVCQAIDSFGNNATISVDENCRNATTCGRQPVRPTPTPTPKKHLSIELIFAISVGGVVLLALVVVLVVLIGRRNGRKDAVLDSTVLTSLVTAQFTE